MIARPRHMIVRPNLEVPSPLSRGRAGESSGSTATKLALDRAGSPLARRSADELFERPAEGRFGFVANFMSDSGNSHGRIGKPLGGNLHAPLGQILNRRTADDLGEALGQRRA